MGNENQKSKAEPRPLPWEFVTDNVSRLRVADGYLWRVREETFFIPTPEYLERLVEGAKKVYEALMELEVKH